MRKYLLSLLVVLFLTTSVWAFPPWMIQSQPGFVGGTAVGSIVIPSPYTLFLGNSTDGKVCVYSITLGVVCATDPYQANLSATGKTDSTSTTSSTVLASATAVKAAYDLANAALPKAGGSIGTTAAGGNLSVLSTRGAELLSLPNPASGAWTASGTGFDLTGATLNKNVTGTGTVSPTTITITANRTYVLNMTYTGTGSPSVTLGGSAVITPTTATDTYITTSSTATLTLSSTVTAGTYAVSAISLKLLDNTTGILRASGPVYFENIPRGYFPYLDSNKMLVAGPIFTDGTNVGIGTTGPSDLLDVYGAIRVTNNVAFDAAKGGRVYKNSIAGMSLQGVTGSTYDFSFFTPAGQILFGNPTGTNHINLVPISGNVGIGTVTFGTSAAKVLGLGLGTAPSTALADMAQMWVSDLNGAGTSGFRFMNEAAATAFTLTGVSASTAVSTGIGSLLMASATVGPTANTGWLTMINNLGVLVYVPYWASATP